MKESYTACQTAFYWPKQLKKQGPYLFFLVFIIITSLPLHARTGFYNNTGYGFQQDRRVTGRLTSASGEALSGASVRVKGSSRGTTTDNNGNFSITVPDNAILVFSAVGYDETEIAVAGKSEINISLNQANKVMEQVIVVGYGSARKKDLTGSSVTVRGSEIINTPVLTATQAIQGKVAGVQITASGAPGSAPNVRIRGTGSILGGADPLYVVDGIITNDIRNINSADILSMDILKDASSTAIYGARAANGVVLITTKAGTKGKFTVNYNAYAGVKLLTHTVEMAGPNLFTIYSNEAAGAPAILASDITGSADWYNVLTRPAIFHNHNLSLSGGKNKYRYFFSAGYLKEQGTLLDNDYTRFTFRYNHDYTISSKFKIGNNLGFSHYISNNKPYSLFTQAYIAAPIYNPKNADGSYGYTTKSDVGNPLATLEYTNDRSWGIRLQGTIWGEYQVMKGLSFRSSFGIDAEQNNGRNYAPVYFVGPTTQKNEVSDLRYSRDSIYQWVWDNFFTWDKKFGTDHNLKVVVGHTAERRNGWSSSATKNGVANDKSLWELNFKDTAGGQQNFRDPIGNYYRRESYFIRANYRFREKYLVNATFRRDANSNFSKKNRWGNFPSIGLGWLISSEDFMAKQTFFDMLKLRASYGWVGNDVIAPGQFDLRPTDQLYAYFGTNRYNGATVTGIVDPNLKWEVVKEFDLGAEFSALNDRFTGELDYYFKRATDALYTVRYLNVGFGNSFLTNAADVVNKGVEIALGWKNSLNKSTRYSLRGNITFNHNNVEKVGLGRAINFGSLGNGWSATQTLVGHSIGSFWVFKTNGIFQNAAEVAAYPHVLNAQPGDLRLVDVNNDGVIDGDDRVHVGSHQPKFYYGFNGTLNWKKFDFALDIFGVSGNKVYNAKKGVRYGGNYNLEYDVAKNRWQPGSNNNSIPRAYNGVPYPSDYFIESGSFVRINNVTVGYNFQVGGGNKRIDQLRVFASANNPYIYTKYTGFTPELPGNQNEAGIELNIYPIASTYTIGVNVQFK
jgi:TonB-linked SusC/RagA family outer membrane protein